MSKFAIPGTTTNTRAPRPVRRHRPTLNANKSVVTSSVAVVTPASKTANKLNLAGGVSYSMSDKMEFLTTCLSWAMLRKKDGVGRMYENEASRLQRIKGLVPRVGAEFAAKTALMIRILDGGRSISHVLAAFIAPYASGETWAEDFFFQVTVRADDMCEIAAAIWKYNGKERANQDTPGLKKMKLPRALLRGFARRFQKLDEYRLAKYANKSSNPSLKQLLQLCRPIPVNEAQSHLFEKLLTDKLVNTETWESQMSAAGQEGKDKGEVWASLIAHRKLGPLALLKNLRNIGQQCTTDVVEEACNQLRDAQSVKNCGILPAQYLTAYTALDNTSNCVKLKLAVDDSVDIAAGNVPSIGNKVLIAIDDSGSMGEPELEAASIFGASLLKSNPGADLMVFSDEANYHDFNRKLPIMELIKQIRSKLGGGGTNFNLIFQHANKAYDTIVILSDAEGWMGSGYGASFRNAGGAPTASRQMYVNKFGINPTIFSFDLGGDGSLMFREDSIITLAGSSFLIFKLLSYLKLERTKLVDIVDTVEIGKPMPKFGEEED